MRTARRDPYGIALGVIFFSILTLAIIAITLEVLGIGHA